MEIFRQSEKLLRIITILALVYIAIHLSSKGFWEDAVTKGPVGIPILGEPYARILGEPYKTLGLFNYITPQDIFLSLFVVFIIIALFLAAPFCIRKNMNIIPIFILLILISLIFLSPLIALISFLIFFIPSCYSYNNKEISSILYCLFSLSLVLSLILAFCIYEYPCFVPSFSVLFNETTDSSKITAISELPPFFITFLVSAALYQLLRKQENMEIPKGCKGDFEDLKLVFCILPAIIVASLVISRDELVKFPNIIGHAVVGLLLISGFSTLMGIVTISFKQQQKEQEGKKTALPPWRNPIWMRSTLYSLGAISCFSIVFLGLQSILDINTFKKILNFSVAVMIMILLYGFLYEKLQKYQFTEWWRREWRPRAMIISILLIAMVSAIDPEPNLPYDIPIKWFGVIFVLVIVCVLPWIIIWFRKSPKGQIPKLRTKSPMNQGVILVKAETGPDKLNEVVDGLDGIDGVYTTMVVRGEYDVCLTVEGVDSDEIAEKILEIRKIKGVASTTTLTDIRESFDREAIKWEKESE